MKQSSTRIIDVGELTFVAITRPLPNSVFGKSPSPTDVNALAAILSRCRELVAESDEFVWSGMDKAEILESLNAARSTLVAGGKPDVDELVMLFAPTGPLQETAIGNLWSDEYINLSARFDEVILTWR